MLSVFGRSDEGFSELRDFYSFCSGLCWWSCECCCFGFGAKKNRLATQANVGFLGSGYIGAWPISRGVWTAYAIRSLNGRRCHVKEKPNLGAVDVATPLAGYGSDIVRPICDKGLVKRNKERWLPHGLASVCRLGRRSYLRLGAVAQG